MATQLEACKPEAEFPEYVPLAGKELGSSLVYLLRGRSLTRHVSDRDPMSYSETHLGLEHFKLSIVQS